MPSLNWHVAHPVRVADHRGSNFLLVNPENGAWAVSDAVGVAAVQMAAGDGGALLPEALRALWGRVPPSPVPPLGVERPEPLVLIYKLTDKCNYRCTYCYDRSVARTKDDVRRSLAVRQFLDRTLPERPVMVLVHGGEPLLEFEELRQLAVDYAAYRPSRLMFSLQTNASRLDQPKLDFLLEHKFGISVSVDGHEPGLNRLRMTAGRPDPYQVLKTKIEKLEGLRANSIGLLMTVGEHNVDRLVDSLLCFQKDGFRSVSFSFMQDVEPGTVCASPAALVQAMMAIVGAIVDGRIETLACMTLIQWVRRIVRGRSGLVCLGSPCGAGRTVATVLANGEVGPCDSIYSDKFYHPDVDTYYRALEVDTNMKALLDRSVKTVSVCSKCDVRSYCNGTCAGAAVLSTGDVGSVDNHECEFNYLFIQELLWALCDEQVGPRLANYCSRHLEEKRIHGI